MCKELEQQVNDFVSQLEEIAENHQQVCEKTVEEIMEEQKKTDEELYTETYQEAAENVNAVLPKIKAVVDLWQDTLLGNEDVLEQVKDLLGETSEVVGVYVNKIVEAAYIGRAKGIVDSYNIFKAKFGSTVALELIKQIH